MLIENHKGIIDLDDTLISAKITGGKLTVTGASLTVRAMAEMKILIEGKIQSVEWD